MSKKRYFLPYELDAFEAAALIATSCGAPIQNITHGNLLMWRHVWRTQCDIISTAHVLAFFGVNACEALVLFGHLEAGEHGWRVKGASEWLRVMTAQSKAGKDKAGNLQKGRQDVSGSPPAYMPFLTEAGGKPSGSPPALPATSDQRPATSDHEKPAGEKPPAVRIRKPKKETPPDPRHAPLVAALATTFEAERGSPLAFDGYQARAVTQLLVIAEPAEVVVRYRRALRHRGFPTVATPDELRKNWDHFASGAPPSKGPVDPTTQTHAEGMLAL